MPNFITYGEEEKTLIENILQPNRLRNVCSRNSNNNNGRVHEVGKNGYIFCLKTTVIPFFIKFRIRLDSNFGIVCMEWSFLMKQSKTIFKFSIDFIDYDIGAIRSVS